jgi:DNA-binding response OmpR family regulator
VSVCPPAVTGLLLDISGSDGALMRDVFARSGWKLFEANGLTSALKCLRAAPVQVVIACQNWKPLLEKLRSFRRPPVLVVASRTADESLWSEVLNIGGFDVLAQPFDRNEVERVVASARRHFDPPLSRACGRPTSAVA